MRLRCPTAVPLMFVVHRPRAGHPPGFVSLGTTDFENLAAFYASDS